MLMWKTLVYLGLLMKSRKYDSFDVYSFDGNVMFGVLVLLWRP